MDEDDCAIFDVARQHLFTKDGGLFTKGRGDDRQPENAEPFGVAPNGFLLDRLGFRLLLGCYEC